jgi:hypothetical protein
MSKPLTPRFVNLSFIVYLLYCALYYVLLVFDHLEPPPVEQELQNAANSLMDEFSRRGNANG